MCLWNKITFSTIPWTFYMRVQYITESAVSYRIIEMKSSSWIRWNQIFIWILSKIISLKCDWLSFNNFSKTPCKTQIIKFWNVNMNWCQVWCAEYVNERINRKQWWNDTISIDIHKIVVFCWVRSCSFYHHLNTVNIALAQMTDKLWNFVLKHCHFSLVAIVDVCLCMSRLGIFFLSPIKRFKSHANNSIKHIIWI